MSARIMTASAIAFAALSFLAAPASACDDRYIKKCESAARAALPAQSVGSPAETRRASCTARFRLCDNCVTAINVITRKDTPCMMQYPAFGSSAVLGQHVTRRGSGIYGTTNSTTAAYQPMPGYVGKDYFEVEISYERSGTKLKTLLQADVTITD